MVLLLLIYCLKYFQLYCWSSVFEFVCYALLCVHSSFAIILKRKRKLVALLLLSCRCIVTINVLWPFIAVPWVGLRCLIIIFPDHTHLLFKMASDAASGMIKVVFQVINYCSCAT